MPMVPNISIATAITEDLLPQLYILMASVKDNKQPDTIVQWTVFVPYTEAHGFGWYDDYFLELNDSMHFAIRTEDANRVTAQINNPAGTKMHYVRCLFPKIFPHLNRLLYLDADIVCIGEGIEELWDADIDGRYAAVCVDPPVCATEELARERENTGANPYFNSGVMLMNLSYMRDSGVADQLADFLQHWDMSKVRPVCYDQSLLNWLFQGNVEWLPLRFNNQFTSAYGFKIPAFQEQAKSEGYTDPLGTVDDTVFIHFCDHDKPWVQNMLRPPSAYPWRLEAEDIWFHAVRQYGKHENPVRIDQKTVVIATTATSDRKDNVYILLNSLKQNMRPGTRIQFYLFVPKNEINDFQQYLTGIPDESFRVTIMDVDWFEDKVNTSGTIRNHLYYARCLFPQVFLKYDKLLYMDIDMACVGPGIEDLWNTDISDYWVGAVIDATWQWCPVYQHDRCNCGTDHYFNNGMMLMNLKKLREDGKDKEFAEWCLHWDNSKLRCICFDQTLCNYLLKDKVKLLPVKYNNSLLASLGVAENAYALQMNQAGFLNPLDSLDSACLVHFCGSKKPWDPEALACSYNEYPYKDEAVELWREIEDQYGKPEIPPGV